MNETFSDKTLQEFKTENKISNIDFQPSTYQEILTTFVDDLAVFTPRVIQRKIQRPGIPPNSNRRDFLCPKQVGLVNLTQ